MKVIYLALLPNHHIFTIYYDNNNDAVDCLNNNVLFKKTIHDFSSKVLLRTNLGDIDFVKDVCIHTQLNKYFEKAFDLRMIAYLAILSRTINRIDVKKYCVIARFIHITDWMIGFTDSLDKYKLECYERGTAIKCSQNGWIKFKSIYGKDKVQDCIKSTDSHIYIKSMLKKEIIICRGQRHRDFDERLMFLMTTCQ
jgi:hypothetical protein